MSYSTVCAAEEAGKLKGTKRSGKSQAGAAQELFWSPEDFAFDNKVDAITKSVWDAAVLAGNLYYIGVVEEFDSNDTEPTYYESVNGNIRLKTAEAKRVRQYRLVECSCTHANLLSFDGQNGRLHIRTSKSYYVARIEDDGKVKGLKTSQFDVGLLTAATSDTPSFTPIDVTFETPVQDDLNVFEDKIDFAFSEVDQIENAELSLSGAVATDGSNLTFDVKAEKGCSGVALTGAVKADFTVKDANGTEISTFTVTETAGTYSFDVTTAETTVFIEIATPKLIEATIYVSEEIKASTT
jgi:hypothetical protein